MHQEPSHYGSRVHSSLESKAQSTWSPVFGACMQGSQGSLWGTLKGFIVTTTGHTLEKQLPLPFRAKVKLYTKTKSARILLYLLDILLHREAWDLSQAQASSVKSLCELRFLTAVRMFVLITKNASETVSYHFPATRCMLNQSYPSAY